MQDALKKVPSGSLAPPDPEPVEQHSDSEPDQASKDEGQEDMGATSEKDASVSETGYKDGADLAWLCDAALLQAYEGIYHHRAAIKAGKDDRMVLVDNTIWTHILRFAGILPGGNEAESKSWTTFCELYEKAKT